VAKVRVESKGHVSQEFAIEKTSIRGSGGLSSPSGVQGQSNGGGLGANPPEAGDKCACRFRKYAYMNTK